jgi:hypothetical protein
VREDGRVSEEQQSPTPRDERAANVFDRFFPGPAPQDPKVAARLEALQHAAERRAAAMRQRESDRAQHPRSDRRPGSPAAAPEPAAAPATAEDLSTLVDALHEQTDVMRALLDADIAIRDDARSTAQNSRTFAVAGIVIAFFTLVAAAVPIVLVVVQR